MNPLDRSLVNAFHSIVRYCWAFPATLLGLLFSVPALCAGATIRRVDGVIEVGGGQLAWLLSLAAPSSRFAAITFGHVIIGVDHQTLEQVRVHEHVHVRQYERWGIVFFPLYIGSSVVQLIRGRDPYLDNRFEREAFAFESKSIEESHVETSRQQFRDIA